MTARIYKPTKNAMQSGKAGRGWCLEFLPQGEKVIDPVIGWTGSADTVSTELRLYFTTKEEAEEYAKAQGIGYQIIEPQDSKIFIKSYIKNFQD